MSWFQKAKDWIVKYWKLLVGAVVLIFFVMKNWFYDRQQQNVLQNEIDARDKIDKIKWEHDEKIKTDIDKAEADHDKRVEKIKNDEKKRLDEVEKKVNHRENENKDSSGDDLAKRLADTFNAELVGKKDE